MNSIRPGENGLRRVIREIQQEIAGCKLCPAMAPYSKYGPEACGNPTTGYMLVGDAPAHDPRPFDARHGSPLRDALSAVGDAEFRELEDLFYIAHVVRCTPPHRSQARRVRQATRVECRNCRPYLELERRMVRPRLVIAVGARAAEAMLQRPVRISELHGQSQPRGSYTVLPLIKPSRHNRTALAKADLNIDSYGRWLHTFFAQLIAALRR